MKATETGRSRSKLVENRGMTIFRNLHYFFFLPPPV
jgi:hypothetical protein